MGSMGLTGGTADDQSSAETFVEERRKGKGDGE